MEIVIASDHETLGPKIQHLLLNKTKDVAGAQLVGLAKTASLVTGQAQPDLLLLVLSPDSEQSLPILKDLRALTRARILAVGPAADSKLVLRALHFGADSYLDEADLEAEIEAALERWRLDHAVEPKLGKMIAVISPSGGSGTSTLAVNIAAALAQVHGKVLLADLNLDGGDLTALLNLKPTHTLADLCRHANKLDSEMLERCLAGHPSGIQLLATPLAAADLHHITADGICQVLYQGRQCFPYVICDFDHPCYTDQGQALQKADVILMVLRLDFTSLRNARRTLEYLDHLEIDRDRIRLVINRRGQPQELSAAHVEEALDLKIAHSIPDDPAIINRANNTGTPVVLENPSAKVARSLTQLAYSVNGQESGHHHPRSRMRFWNRLFSHKE